MANQQLLDYVKQQLQLGVPKDSVKSALLASGWPAPEVDEALSGPASPAATSPAATSPSVAAASPAASAPVISKPAANISNMAPATSALSGGASKAMFQSKNDPIFKPAAPAGGKGFDDISHPAHPHHWLLPAILGVVVVALLAGVWYLYSQNSALSSQLVTSTDSAGSINQQVSALTTDKANLNSQLTNANNANRTLSVLLSLFAPSTSTISENISGLAGTLGGSDKTGYTLLTPQLLSISLKITDPALLSSVKAMVGAAITVDGSYLPGSKTITVTKAVGNPSASGSTVPTGTPTPTSTPAAASTQPAPPTAPTSTPPAPGATSTAATTPKAP